MYNAIILIVVAIFLIALYVKNVVPFLRERSYIKMEIERSFLSIVFKNLERFIQRESKYEDLDELTPYALRELVKASA